MINFLWLISKKLIFFFILSSLILFQKEQQLYMPLLDWRAIAMELPPPPPPPPWGGHHHHQHDDNDDELPTTAAIAIAISTWSHHALVVVLVLTSNLIGMKASQPGLLPHSPPSPHQLPPSTPPDWNPVREQNRAFVTDEPVWDWGGIPQHHSWFVQK